MFPLMKGATSGAIATIPMTAVMLAGHRMLPRREQYPLPPREIVDKISEEAGIDKEAPEEVLRATTWISHFGYGAAMGGIYAAVKGSIPCPAQIRGPAFGTGVWIASYMGLLPALKILKPAEKHPLRRTALMIAAHLVWGTALQFLDEYLESSNINERLSLAKDKKNMATTGKEHNVKSNHKAGIDARGESNARYGDISVEEGRENGGRERVYQEKNEGLPPYEQKSDTTQGAGSKVEGAFGKEQSSKRDIENVRYRKDEKQNTPDK